MLSKVEFQQLRDSGLSVDQIVAFESGQTPQDLARQNQTATETAGNQFSQEAPVAAQGGAGGFGTKARNFITGIIGGGKLAEGAGMALAAPGVRKETEESQRVTEFQQRKLLDTIREKRSRGEDTSRLEGALKKSQGISAVTQDTQKDFEEALPTSKQVIGSSARLATTLAGGTIGKAAAKATALGKSTTFLGGMLRGLGTGAISGGTIGGLEGVGYGMEQNQSAGGIAKSGAIGAAAGVALGGPLGAIGGGISGSLKGRALARENFAKSLVAPKETPASRAAAIEEGRLVDPGLFRKAELEFSKRDERLANSVKDVVSPNKSLSQNVDAIRSRVGEINAGVSDYIAQNKVPYNTNQLKTRLMDGKDELELIFASDSNAEKTYNAVVEAFMDHVGKKDTKGLFDARQTFDRLPAIKKLLESDKLGENARKEIVLGVRRSANKYIASLLPEGNIYRESMLAEANLLEALGNLAEKSQGIIGKSRMELLVKEYPLLEWVVGLASAGVAGAIGGSLYGGALGFGGATIQSSD